MDNKYLESILAGTESVSAQKLSEQLSQRDRIDSYVKAVDNTRPSFWQSLWKKITPDKKETTQEFVPLKATEVKGVETPKADSVLNSPLYSKAIDSVSMSDSAKNAADPFDFYNSQSTLATAPKDVFTKPTTTAGKVGEFVASNVFGSNAPTSFAVGAARYIGDVVEGTVKLVTPKSLETDMPGLQQLRDYKPKTFTDKLAAKAGELTSFMYGARLISPLVESIPFVSGAGETLMKNGVVRKIITGLESQFPRIYKGIFGAEGFREAVNKSIKLAMEFNILNQASMQDPTFKERVNDAVVTTLSAGPLSRLSAINGPITRTSMHVAYGTTMAQLQGSDTEDSIIEGIVWGSMGAMGGVKLTEKSMKKDFTAASADVLYNIPSVAADVKAVKLFIDEAPDTFVDYPIEVKTTAVKPRTVSQPEEVITETIPTTKAQEISTKIEKIKVESEKTNKEFLKHIVPSEVLSKVESRDTIDIKSALEKSELPTDPLGFELAIRKEDVGFSFDETVAGEGGVEIKQSRGASNWRDADANSPENRIYEAIEGEINKYNVVVPEKVVSPEKEAISFWNRLDARISELENKIVEAKKPETKANLELERDALRSLAENKEANYEIAAEKYPEFSQSRIQRESRYATDSDRAAALRVAKAVGVDAEFADTIKGETKYYKLEELKRRMLWPKVQEIYSALSNPTNNNPIEGIKISIPVDKPLLENTIRNFIDSDGSEASLKKALLEADGKETKRAQDKTSNAVAQQLGFENVKDMFHFLEKEYPDIMKKTNSNNAAADMLKNLYEDMRITEYREPGKETKVEKVEWEDTRVEHEAVKKGEIYDSAEIGQAEIEAKSKGLKTPKDLMVALSDRLEFILEQSRLPKGVEGRAFMDKAVKMKEASFDVATHEATHILNFRYKITDKAPEEVIKQLVEGLDPKRINVAAYSKDKLPGEGLSEMMRSYLTGEEMTGLEKAVEFTKEQIVKESPELWDFLEQVRQDSITWNEAPVLARQIASTEVPIEKTFLSKMKEAHEGKVLDKKLGNLITDTYRRAINLGAYYYELDTMNGKDPKELGSLWGTFNTMANRVNGLFDFLVKDRIPQDVKQILGFTPEQFVKPKEGVMTLEQIFTKTRDYSKEFGQYLINKELEIRYEKDKAAGKKSIYPDQRTPEQIAEANRAVERMFPDVVQMAEEVAKFNASLVAMRVQAGDLTPEDAAKIADSNYYSSLVRYGGIFAGDFEFAGKYLDTTYKQYLGSSRGDIVDPMISMLVATNSTAKSIITNDLLRKIARQAETNPTDKARLVDAPLESTNVNIETAKRILKDFSGLDEVELQEAYREIESNPELLGSIFSSTSGIKDGIYTVKVDGKNKYLKLSKELVDSLGLSEQKTSLDSFIKTLHSVTKWKKALTTTLSASFLFKNVTRDTVDAYMRATKLFIPGVDNYRGLRSVMKQDSNYKNAMLYGLNGEGMVMEDFTSLKESMFGIGADSVKKQVKYGFSDKLINTMRMLSNYSEMSTRMGVFGKHDASSPEGIYKAVLDAQNATFHWRQRGMSDSAISTIDKVNAFFKANLVAFDQTASSLSLRKMLGGGNEKEETIRTYKRAAPLVAASLIHAFANWDNDEYWNEPIYKLTNGIPIPTKKGLLMIPVANNPYFVAFWALPQMLVRQLRDHDSEYAKAWLKDVAGTAIPIFSGEKPSVSGAVANLMPDVIRPFAELYFNKTLYQGTPIVPDSLKGKDAREQYSKYTSGMAVAIGEALGISPMKVEYGLRNIAFSAYDLFVSTLMDSALSGLGINPNKLKEGSNLIQSPIIKQFYREKYGPTNSASYTIFSERYDKYKVSYDTYNSILKKDPTKAASYFKNNQTDIQMYLMANGFMRSVKAGVQAYFMVESSKSIPSVDKESRLANLRRQIADQTIQANQLLNSYEDNPKVGKE